MNSEKTISEMLKINDLPKSSEYPAEWVIENSMGPNVLWFTEWLTQAMHLKHGMRVLDLGCGKAISSIFLAKEFGCQVWATDLWTKANDNLKRIKSERLEEQVFPIHSDARSLPFAHGFFDAIIAVDSYFYFGTDDLYLGHIRKFLKKDGEIGIATPGLMKEFPAELPQHLKKFWGEDCWGWHTKEWWEHFWKRTGLVEILSVDNLKDGCKRYLQWKLAQEELGKNPWPDDLSVLEKDNGEYIGFIRMVARNAK